MTSAVSTSLGTDWKTLYRSAILEPDKSVLCEKVFEAESAILARARELFYEGGTSDEKEALEEALYLLRAYQNACEYADMDISGEAATDA